MKAPGSPVEAAHWIVSGRVQGVGFRWFVQRAAQRIGVRGDVRNLPDGTVEVRAEGSADELGRLLSAVREGPSCGRVDRVVELQADPDLHFLGFDIRF
jgi:acylphosphatase